MRIPPNRRQLLTVIHDAVMAGLSLIFALYLRLGDDMTAFTGRERMAAYTVLCVGICMLFFFRMRLYRGLWRYASTPDLVAITKAVTLALFTFYVVLFAATRLAGIPRSVPFIEWLLLLALLGAPRFCYRIVRDRKFSIRDTGAEGRIPVLLVGAGDRAEVFMRDTKSGLSAQYAVVGILDDNPLRAGHAIHNVRIFGGTDMLPQVVEQLAREGNKPQRLILTHEHLDGAKVRRLFNAADALGLTLARLPQLAQFREGMKKENDIRPIAVEDLLGRAQNVHDKSHISAILKGKTVMVTGAGGTIGAELVRQIATFAPACILLYELSEYALYLIDLELGRDFRQVARKAIIGDVRNEKQVNAVFRAERPDVVFHAAAIKHVPLAEANPEEAVLTNVQGTMTVADACAAHKVGVMVLISTDKAINPSSVMGASKRVAEGYVQALGGEAKLSDITRFAAVRFGNVLGSTGSVVPLFTRQLQAGGPLTVTHPDMVRYFMTVREAVELVLLAGTLTGRNGEVYVLDMGQPVRILDLAEQMIRLSGLKPYTDIKIEFTGLRPGEKMFEELFHATEASDRTIHEGLWLAHPPKTAMKQFAQGVTSLLEAAKNRDGAGTVKSLQALVPEYVRGG